MASVILAHALTVMDRPWAWGQCDCCIAACDVFQKIHGVDLIPSFRGIYNTKTGAYKIINRFGGFLPMARSIAACSNLRPGNGRAGEIGVTSMEDGTEALVISYAEGMWVGKSLTGLSSTDQVKECWSV